MFKAISRLLSARQTPTPNPRQAVDDFRAKKRAEGFTKAEISAILVASRIASEAVFIANGWSDKAINKMNWAHLFDNPPAPLPTKDFVVYPSDWRVRQEQYRREGYPDHIIHETLQGIGARQWHNAQPPSLWETRPCEEKAGSRAESLARLIEQGYTEKEIREVFDARIRASGIVNRYPDLEEAPFVALLASRKKTATRPQLQLVVSRPAAEPR